MAESRFIPKREGRGSSVPAPACSACLEQETWLRASDLMLEGRECASIERVLSELRSILSVGHSAGNSPFATILASIQKAAANNKRCDPTSPVPLKPRG